MTKRMTIPVSKATKKAIARSVHKSEQEDLLRPRPTVTRETMERWHRSVARVGGLLSLTLARQRRAPDLVERVLAVLEPTVEDMRKLR